MASASKNSGKLVKTKNGELGYTKSTDPLINGKQPVYLSKSDKKILCDPTNLKILGYYD